MAVNTILLDFSLDYPQIGENVRDSFETILSTYFSELLCICESELSDGGRVILYSASSGVLITFRIFLNGLLTLNIEYYKEDEKPLITYQQVQSLESDINLKFQPKRSKSFPPVKRGATFDVYLNSSDERLIEYDFDELLFEEYSPYQKVQVVHSKTLGNMLILDGLQNLSEKDLIYTETLMHGGQEDYKDKEIIILGGGDGALLNALLKEEPTFVHMLELDDVVVTACSQFLRSCCGDVLDKMKGNNYEIIIGDCVETLEKMSLENRQFDYVFGDLTDSPLQISHKGHQTWDFVKLIINMSFHVLKPHGKYITHCCGTSSTPVIEEFENMLASLGPSVNYRKVTAFVPSFMEDWIFYTIWR